MVTIEQAIIDLNRADLIEIAENGLPVSEEDSCICTTAGELIILLEELKRHRETDFAKNKNMDYIMKINMYLIEKYRNELLREFGMEEQDMKIENMIRIFDKIYKIENEKYPFAWCEYCSANG